MSAVDSRSGNASTNPSAGNRIFILNPPPDYPVIVSSSIMTPNAAEVLIHRFDSSARVLASILAGVAMKQIDDFLPHLCGALAALLDRMSRAPLEMVRQQQLLGAL